VVVATVATMMELALSYRLVKGWLFIGMKVARVSITVVATVLMATNLRGTRLQWSVVCAVAAAAAAVGIKRAIEGIATVGTAVVCTWWSMRKMDRWRL
jgi:hypothetical protein